MAQVAVIGDIYTDIQTGPLTEMPRWGCDLHADNIKVVIGGSGANTSRYLGCLGSIPQLFTALGNDNLGRMHLQHLTEEKLVRTNTITVIENTNSPTAVVLFGNTERGFISNNGCLSKYTVDKIDKEILFKSRHLHIGGYFVCRALQTQELVDLLQTLREKRITISMDCQFDSTLLWTGSEGNIFKVLPLLDVFMPSEVEAKSISKTSSIQEAIVWLCKRMPFSLLIVKNGDKGAFYRLPLISASDPRYKDIPRPEEKMLKLSQDFTDEEIKSAIVHTTTQSVKVLDTTGAGDCFNAGFLFSLLQLSENDEKNRCDKEIKKSSNGNIDELKPSSEHVLESEKVSAAVKFACELGSKCVQKIGAFNCEVIDL